MNETKVRPASGKLGVMCVGLGAVTTTTIIGTLMARKGLSKPIGSFACDGIMRLGQGSDKIYKEVKHILPIASLDEIVFGAWDIYELLPAFIVGLIVIVVVSLLTPAPSMEIIDTYDEVKENCKGF